MTWRAARVCTTTAALLATLASLTPAAEPADGDMEAPDRGPWQLYGTPTAVEKTGDARSGARALRVVTDNRETMGGNYEGASHGLGEFRQGDLLRLSFWYNVRGSGALVVGLGTTYFMGRWVLSGTDWTRADLTLRCPRTAAYSVWFSQEDRPTEFRLDDVTLDVQRRPDLGQAPADRRVTLAGGPLELAFCRDSGALCGIANRTTGEVLAPFGLRQPLLSLEYLAPDGAASGRVPFAALELLDLTETAPAALELRFRSPAPAADIRLRVEVSPDGAATVSGRVTNRSEQRLLAVEAPVVAGVCPARDPANLTLVDPYVCGRIVPHAIASDGLDATYPGRAVMGWLDLYGEQGGLYLATHDRTSQATRLSALPAPGPAFDLALTREVTIGPGESWPLPDSVLAVHAGDWHAAADRYRAWARTWMQPPDVPEWLRRSDGWVLVGVQNGIPFRRLPDCYQQAEWMGVDLLHVQGQGTDTMWSDAAGTRQHHAMTFPYPSPRAGTPLDLLTAVRQIHLRRGRVLFYFLYDRWTPSHSTADDLGTGRRTDVPPAYQPPPPAFYPDNALLETPATQPPADHPFMTDRLMCLAAPGWQQWMRRWAIDVYAREYEADGMYWDVMGRNGPFRCFNPAHHHHGDNRWADGAATVLATTLRQGRARKPEYTCAIEGASDVLGQWVGLHLLSGATLTPNVFRYTFPEYLCIDGFSNTTWTLSHVQKAHRVFLDGERFDLHGYDQRVKRILDLRRRLKAFTDWPAVFTDTVGLTPSDPHVQARAFRRTDGTNRTLAVTLMNEDRLADAALDVDLGSLGKPLTISLFRLDGSVVNVPAADSPRQRLPVPPDEVAGAVFVVAAAPDLCPVAWAEPILTPGLDGLRVWEFYPLDTPADRRPGPPRLRGLPDSLATATARHLAPRLTAWDCLLPDGYVDLPRWTRVDVALGPATAWTVLAPPLVNGDFERAADGRLDGWDTPPCTEKPGQGQRCLRLDRDSAPDHLLTQLTPLKPACRYRFRAMLRRSVEATGWAGAHVVEYLEGAEFVRSAVLNSSRTGDWESLETVFTSHPDPRTTAVYLYNFDDRQPAWFDALSLEEVPTP